MQLTSSGMVEKVIKEVTAKLLQARILSELFQAMEAALERMERKAGGPLELAVRSSALGEDSTLSFAGQFKSLLHISRAEVPKAYLEVLASVFSPEAIHYRILHRIPPESAESPSRHREPGGRK